MIKPTVLSYLKGGQRIEVLPGSQQPPAVATRAAAPSSTSKLPPTTPKSTVLKRDVLTSPRPVIQNGTLAAASALMTLFGENSPQGS